MTLTGRGMVAGVLGRPIGHSLSPVLHNAWLSAAGLDGVYVPVEVEEDRFERLIDGLRGGSVRGLNVTAPFKERALAVADEADAAARSAGAANLLLFETGGEVRARNTDGIGLLRAVAEQAPALSVKGASVVILGAGGAARGAAATLLEAGAGRIRLVNRTVERAEALAERLGPQASAGRWGETFDDADLLINATTLGREGGEPLSVSLAAMDNAGVVMDMIYRPLQTELLRRAAARGMSTVDGLAMLIGQAVPSFTALFGRPPPDVDVRRAALEAIG